MVWSSKKYTGISALVINEGGYDEIRKTHWMRFYVDPASLVFEGHFPENPILPGVCLIDAAQELVSKNNIEKIQFSVQKIRLQKVLFPGMTGLIEACRDCVSIIPKWKVSVIADGDLVARFDLVKEGVVNTKAASKIANNSDEEDLVTAVQRLPHRAPFHLVDHAKRLSDGKVVTERYVSSNQLFLEQSGSKLESQTFILPQALLIESFLQSGALMLDKALTSNSLAIFGGAGRISLFAPVFAGSNVEQRVWLKYELGDALIVDGETVVEGQIVAEFKGIILVVRPAEQIIPAKEISKLEFA